MTGIGFGIALVPCSLIVVQYFVKRLGIANVIGSIGEGLGGLILSPLYTLLLEEYGWRGTLLLLSGFILNCFVCAVICMPPSCLKASTKSNSQKTSTFSLFSISFGFIRNPRLALHLIGIGLSFLGFVPVVHLADLGVQTGINKYQAAYLVSIIGVFNVVGSVLFGWISDFQCTNVILLQSVSLMMCGVDTAICPHLTEFFTLALYSVIFGTFMGTSASLIPIVSRVLTGLKSTGDFLGLPLFFGGIFSIVGSPFVGWLFDMTKTYNASFYVVGVLLALGGVINMVVMVLHSQQVNQKAEETVREIEVQTVSRSHIDTQQDSQYISSLEQTYM